MFKKIQPLPLKSIIIKDSFWKNYMELIRTKVIPYQWRALNDEIEGAEPSYCIQNFKVASGKISGKFQGMVFQDSDVYKWIEAVAYSLAWHSDPSLEGRVDGVIDLICSAQQEDGYLNTYYIINGLENRFTNLKDNHELYCLGHLIEAAVAYYHVTEKKKLLDAAISYVNLVADIFGEGPKKLKGYPGHEIIEMALVKLYKITNEDKHLKLIRFFINERGKEPLFFEKETLENNNSFFWKDSFFKYQYYQAGREVRKQNIAEGHAVRAVYLYSGMSDLAQVDEDYELFKVCENLWNNITSKQMYINGGIGASHYGESFTFDYDLPNDTVYGETCASIGLVFFAQRMFLMTGDSKYMDILEKTLYNGVISGMTLDGERFFYVNPLEVFPEASEKDHSKSHVKVERQKWFACACCPPNLARTIASLSNYAYAQLDDKIYINLYVGGEINANINSEECSINIASQYPWKGFVEIVIDKEICSEFEIAMRIPDWCKKYTVTLNNEKIDLKEEFGYVSIKRLWKKSDTITIDFEMSTTLIQSNPKVRENSGKVALSQGPIIYCLEEEDNGSNLHQVFVDCKSEFISNYRKDLFNGVNIISNKGYFLDEMLWRDNALYKPYIKNTFVSKELTWIPYYAWANRNPGEMRVWINHFMNK